MLAPPGKAEARACDDFLERWANDLNLTQTKAPLLAAEDYFKARFLDLETSGNIKNMNWSDLLARPGPSSRRQPGTWSLRDKDLTRAAALMISQSQPTLNIQAKNGTNDVYPPDWVVKELLKNTHMDVRGLYGLDPHKEGEHWFYVPGAASFDACGAALPWLRFQNRVRILLGSLDEVYDLVGSLNSVPRGTGVLTSRKTLSHVSGIISARPLSAITIVSGHSRLCSACKAPQQFSACVGGSIFHIVWNLLTKTGGLVTLLVVGVLVYEQLPHLIREVWEPFMPKWMAHFMGASAIAIAIRHGLHECARYQRVAAITRRISAFTSAVVRVTENCLKLLVLGRDLQWKPSVDA